MTDYTGEQIESDVVERVIQIIMYLIKQITANESSPESFQKIDVSPLRDKGYNDVEISTAFSWLVEKTEEIVVGRPFVADSVAKATSFRFLHPGEQLLFSSEAIGELTQLQSLGLVASADIERIVDQAYIYGYSKMSLSEFRLILGEVVFSNGHGSAPSLRKFLSGSDTVH